MSSNDVIFATALIAIINGETVSDDILPKLKEILAARAAMSADEMMHPVDAVPSKPAKTQKAPKPSAPVVVATSAPGAAVVGPANDTMRAHPSRLQVVNPGLCMARKIDEERVVAGTNKGEIGANGKVFYEKQCSKAPLPGEKLCKICAKKETEASGDQKVKGWYGRFDDVTFYKWAYVVGCPWYFENYPKGIAGNTADAVSSTPEQAASVAPVDSESVPAPVLVEKKKGGRKAKTAESMVTAPESTVTESVAVDAAPKPVEWVMGTWTNSAGISRSIVRHMKTNNVYAYNSESLVIDDAAIREQFLGRWVNSTLDEYAEEIAE